jgi:hypothetical protein
VCERTTKCRERDARVRDTNSTWDSGSTLPREKMPHHDGFTLHLRYGLILLELDGDLLLHDEDQALLSRSSVLSLENTHSVPPRVPRASPGPRFESPMPWTVISTQSRSPTGVHPACEAQRKQQLAERSSASGVKPPRPVACSLRLVARVAG